MSKQLYRSEDNKIIAGLVGGIAEYFDIDPVLLRLVTIVVMVATGFIPVIVIYLLALLVVPVEVARVIDVEEEKN